MSGFEIAGVVLGGLPLVLKAAEQYKSGLEPLVKWHRYKREFRSFVHDVDIEKQMFDALIDRLLQYTDLSIEQKDMLLTGQDPEGWCRDETEKALRRRLGASYDSCRYLLKALENDLITLQGMLSLKDGSVEWARPGEDKWHYQRKRIAHSFSKKGPETIASLSHNIKRFRDLLDVLDERVGTTKQEQRKASSSDTTWAKIFECIRKQALSLHSALKAGWKCTCEVPHVTSLQLQQRATGEWESQFILCFNPPSHSKKSWDTKRKFIVAISQKKAEEKSLTIRPAVAPLQEGYINKLKSNIETSSPADKQLAFYKETDFRSKSSPSSTSSFNSLRKALKSSPFATNTANGCPPGAPPTCQTTPTKPKQKKTVGWNVPAPSTLQVPPALAHSVSTPNLLPPHPPEPCDSTVQIHDLCSILVTYEPTISCIGYLADPENHHHEFRSLKSNFQSTSSNLISLEALLNRTQPLLRLRRKQQYRLTVILASSLLQLQTTPWMTGKLEKKDIFFEYEDGEIFAEQPFIHHSFSSANLPPTTIPTAAQTPSSLRFATRASLVQLGILLLELCFGAPIEAQTQHRTSHMIDGITPHNDTDFLTARDWVSDVEGEAGVKFSDAIRACVGFNDSLSAGKKSWEDRLFMEEVYAGVVRPLEDMLEDFGWGDEGVR